MDPECRRISRLILPAVRASVAEAMRNEHNYRQKEIAEKLGVVQVAVSKYLNGRYSPEIARLKDMITRDGSSRSIIEGIASGESSETIGIEINRLCESLAERAEAGSL